MIGDPGRRDASTDEAGISGRVRVSGTRPLNVLVELGCLGLGLGVELPLQRIDAEVVLAERGFPTSEPRIEPHERAVNGFLQCIQGEEAEAGLDGALGGAGPLLGEEAPQCLHGQLPQTLPLGGEPIVERALGQSQPRQ